MDERRALATVEQVSEYLGVPVQTLYAWRSRGGRGPKASRIGRHLRYRWSDVEKYIDEQTSGDHREAS